MGGGQRPIDRPTGWPIMFFENMPEIKKNFRERGSEETEFFFSREKEKAKDQRES